MDAATSTTETDGASSHGRAEAQGRDSQDREFFVGLGRAFAGAVIFALPMLMTMELWLMGVYVSPLRLVVLMVAMVPLLTGLSMISGFKHTASLLGDVVDAFVAVAVAAVMSAVVLFLFGIVTLDTPVNEALGRIALQVIPASIGAMLARSQVSGVGKSGGRSEQHRSYGHALSSMATGALFLGVGLAPTDEVLLLAYGMEPWQEIALALLSLSLMHAFVYAVGFATGVLQHPGVTFWSLFARFTIVGYAVVLVVAFCLLWTFGRTDGTEAKTVLSASIVLGFPCAIGAAAARLIL